jgi:hypothetical protein
MYSNIQLVTHLGSPFGDHQRIDRLAYRLLLRHTAEQRFPSLAQIL